MTRLPHICRRLPASAKMPLTILRQAAARMPTSTSAVTFFALFFVSASAVHAGTPKPLDITEQRNAAVGYAVTAALAVRRMALACKAVPATAAAFPEAERQWDARNGAYVEASFGWLAYVKQFAAAQQGAAAADALVEQMRKAAIAAAIKAVAEAVPGDPPAAADCQQWVAVLDSGQFDLERNPEFSSDLHDIWEFHKAVAAAYDH